MPDTQTTLRETLESSFDAAEQAAPVVESTTSDRVRDEAGKFAKTETKPQVADTQTQIDPAQAQAGAVQAEQRPQRPSTWKKDYWEQWDKLDPKLAQYINQRESEYKTGVSTYKAEADNARGLNEALAPFMPDLQRNNIDPKTWISNLGNAHRKLALGSPDEKLQMFAQLARDYGVPLPGLAQSGQADPRTQWMEQQLNTLRGTVDSFMSQQQAHAQAEIERNIESFAADSEKHPHFEKVRDNMAELLQAGLAPDLETAYQKAVRMHDDTFQELLNQHQNSRQDQVQAAVRQAKSQVISPKTSTPRSAATEPGPKDRRSALEAGFATLTNDRL